MRIGFISGTSRKFNEAKPAGEMYQKSALFKYALGFCQRNYDQTYILSARHGLLFLDTTIEPYEQDINSMRRKEFNVWLENTYRQIKEKMPAGSTLFFHTGRKYRELIPLLREYESHIPLAGLAIGQQLKFYKERAQL